ncbi:MAG: hypothetical protein HKN19_05290, partial [Halioglobus sp.]|nr:hypothetical protein [Halioglobus sp.]
MKILTLCLRGVLALALCLPAMSNAEDIDIFTGANEVNLDLPNVIFILDNTSNWSRQSQDWPGGLTQGQSEVRAIATVLEAQIGNLNVGLLEYSTQGSGSDNDGAYVRFNLQELTASSKDELDVILETIFDNINATEEKRASSNPYADLPWDLYNYLAGEYQSKLGAGTPSTLADAAGYLTQFDQFDSPLNALDACGDVYLIFIGNNANGSITTDSVTNTNALKALYAGLSEDPPDALAGDSGTPLKMPEFVSITTTEPGELQGTSAQCWKESEVSACTAAENDTGGLCDGLEDCSCTEKAGSHPGCTTGGAKANRTYRWNVATADSTSTTAEATGGYDTTGGLQYNFDDWTKFLYNYGVPLDLSLEDFGIDPDDAPDNIEDLLPDRINVVTYTIDVFNKQQEADLSELWFSAADAGGGRYFQAKSEDDIVAAISTALSDILSVSTSFAAVTMPLSATNRARVDNQVYIGMFRPSPGKKPRWYGNLKRYQLGLFDGVPRLADVNLRQAINPLSGFARECAESYWTTDTETFWENLAVNPPPQGACTLGEVEPWSDLPDGPFVEKGGVAQQVRELDSSADRNVL